VKETLAYKFIYLALCPYNVSSRAIFKPFVAYLFTFSILYVSGKHVKSEIP